MKVIYDKVKGLKWLILFLMIVSSCNTNKIEKLYLESYSPDSLNKIQNWGNIVNTDTIIDSTLYSLYEYDRYIPRYKFIHSSKSVLSQVIVENTSDSMKFTLKKPSGLWIAIHELDSNKRITTNHWGPKTSNFPRQMTIHRDSLKSTMFYLNDYGLHMIYDSLSKYGENEVFGIQTNRYYLINL